MLNGFRQRHEHLVHRRNPLGAKDLGVGGIQHDDGGGRADSGALGLGVVLGDIQLGYQCGGNKSRDLLKNGPRLDAGVAEQGREEKELHALLFRNALVGIFEGFAR